MNLKRHPLVIFRSFVDFFRDDGLMLAGSLSYFTVMAIVPFCLFLVTIFGHFLGMHEGFLRFFSAKLVSFFPTITYKITEELRKIITYKGLGSFTLVLYGFLSYQLFASLESSVNMIFKVKAKRPFALSLVYSLFIVTLIVIFILVSFGATSAISMLKILREFFPDLKISRITGFLIGVAVPFVLVFLTVATLYRFLPRHKIKAGNAFTGALFTALLLEAAKHLFTFYVKNVAKMGTIYGPLSAFVIFLLWVFYSSCIFLIGAEVVRNLGAPKGR